MLKHDRHIALDRVRVRRVPWQVDASDGAWIVEAKVPRPLRLERQLDRAERLTILEEEGETHMSVAVAHVEKAGGFVARDPVGRVTG